MSRSRPPLWMVLRAHLLADKRKTAVLAGLVLVMAVVYLKLFLKSGRPQEADAQAHGAVVAPEPAVAQTPTADRPHDQGDRLRLSQPLRRDLATDPFAVPWDRFALVAGGTEEPAATAVEEPMTQPSGSSVAEAAAALVLQSTLCGEGDRPIACINGEMVYPGDTIAGFTLMKVEPTRVVLERDGVRIALSMR